MAAKARGQKAKLCLLRHLAESWPGPDAENDLTTHLSPELPFSAGHSPTWPHGYSTGGGDIECSVHIYHKPRRRGENFGWAVLPSTPPYPVAHPDYRAWNLASAQKPGSESRSFSQTPVPWPKPRRPSSLVCKNEGAACSRENWHLPSCEGFGRNQSRSAQTQTAISQGKAFLHPSQETRMGAELCAGGGALRGAGLCAGGGALRRRRGLYLDRVSPPRIRTAPPMPDLTFLWPYPDASGTFCL